MTNTEDNLKFGALPALVDPAPVRVMPKDLETLIYWARQGADDVRNEILDQVTRNIAST